MTDILVPDNGKLRTAADVQLADEVIRLKNQKDPWAVVDLLVKAWAKKAPYEEKAMKLNVRDYRENLTDKKYGQTKDGKHMERRFTVAFPKTLFLMIGAIYKPADKEFVMDNKFYAEFARRYPAFQIPDKV